MRLPGTLNLRGSDIDYNPVFWAYLVIPLASPPTLFVNIEQMSDAVYAHLEKNGVRIEPYDSVVSYLEGVSKTFGPNVRLALLCFQVVVDLESWI